MAHEDVSLYRQTLADRQHAYDAAISAGEYTPFLYPWDTLPALYLLLAVIISPRLPHNQARAIRYIAFALVLLHDGFVIFHRRTLWFAGGYGIGLSSTWGAIMSGAVLICNDISKDFKRLEIRPVTPKPENHLQNGSAANSTSSVRSEDVNLRNRKVASIYTSTDTRQIASAGSDQAATRPYKLVWQGYPRDGSWLHVLDWSVDLLTSFRGVGWRHRIPTLGEFEAPCMPDEPEHQSQSNEEKETRPTSISVQNLRSLQLRAVQDFILTYLLLDFLKTTLVTDPYFLGLAPLESPTPWEWLARVNQTVPIATRVVRLLMSMTGVIAALTFIFSLSPLFFSTILPKLVDISKFTKAPLLEPALYPPMWYPISTSVMHSGLAGFWGKFWHQMFRFGISEPSRALIKKFGLNSRSDVARVLQLLVAFALSGSIHAFGSYSGFSLQPSRPVSGSFTFFLLQGVGIFLQSSVVDLLSSHVPSSKYASPGVRGGLNLLFVVVWLYFTGPLLADDFARCGIWLFEPVPISPLRGLGFGPGGKDEGWWTWYQDGSRMVGWWQGDRWWNTGLAIY